MYCSYTSSMNTMHGAQPQSALYLRQGRVLGQVVFQAPVQALGPCNLLQVLAGQAPAEHPRKVGVAQRGQEVGRQPRGVAVGDHVVAGGQVRGCSNAQELGTVRSLGVGRRITCLAGSHRQPPQCQQLWDVRAGLQEQVQGAQVKEGSTVPVRAGQVRQALWKGQARQGRQQGCRGQHAGMLAGACQGWCNLLCCCPATSWHRLAAMLAVRRRFVSEHVPRTQPSTLQHSQRSAHTSQHIASHHKSTHTGAPASGEDLQRASPGCGNPRSPGPAEPGGLWRLGSLGWGAGGWSAPAQRRTWGPLGRGGVSGGWGLRRGYGLQPTLC